MIKYVPINIDKVNDSTAIIFLVFLRTILNKIRVVSINRIMKHTAKIFIVSVCFLNISKDPSFICSIFLTHEVTLKEKNKPVIPKTPKKEEIMLII
ncbi:hypothetical protein D3C85_1485640 [compost metagenome]